MAQIKSNRAIAYLLFAASQLMIWPLICIIWILTDWCWKDRIILLEVPMDLGITLLAFVVSLYLWTHRADAIMEARKAKFLGDANGQ